MLLMVEGNIGLEVKKPLFSLQLPGQFTFLASCLTSLTFSFFISPVKKIVEGRWSQVHCFIKEVLATATKRSQNAVVQTKKFLPHVIVGDPGMQFCSKLSFGDPGSFHPVFSTMSRGIIFMHMIGSELLSRPGFSWERVEEAGSSLEVARPVCLNALR